MEPLEEVLGSRLVALGLMMPLIGGRVSSGVKHLPSAFILPLPVYVNQGSTPRFRRHVICMLLGSNEKSEKTMKIRATRVCREVPTPGSKRRSGSQVLRCDSPARPRSRAGVL